MVNPWKFLGVKKLHSHLCSRFDIYRKWHWHPHHHKVHWAVLGTNIAIFIVISAISLAPFHSVKTHADAPALTVSPSGYTNIDSFNFTLTGDPIVGAVKYQYRNEEDDPITGWIDFNPILSESITIPNADHPNGKYTEGENLFYFRALDGGDIIIPGSELSKSYYYNITPPGQVEYLDVIPVSNDQNAFTFTWGPPNTYVGDLAKVKYHYSVNATPTPFNTNITNSNSVGPLPFATQKGENKFYVVPEDEAGNIEYGNYYYEVAFTANTTAPGIPTNVTIDDISDKDTGQYRLVTSWTPPAITDPGNFAGYDVYHSTSEGGSFTKIATTSDTAYVNTGLTQNSTHYYYVVATDKTGNVSANSTVVHATADGHYTTPANITKNPVVSAMSRTASVNWGTSRVANSYVEYGKTNALGQATGNSSNQYVTDHTVTLSNLEPATTYDYRAVFTDPDGNTGQTVVSTFTTSASPAITDFKIENVSTSSMMVSFKTSVPSHGEVLYGTTPSYGSTAKEDSSLVTNHVVRVEGLADGTKYYVGVKETDAEGGTFTPDIYEISTVSKPRISDLKVQGEKNVNNPTIQVAYSTNVETTTYIKYTPEGGTTKEYSTMSYTKDHKIELTDLTPLKLYTLEVTGNDRFGNTVETKTEKFTTLSDTMPPKIMNLTEKKKVIGEGASAIAVLTVKMTTNEPSAIIIEASQGIDTKSFNIVSAEDPLNTEHTIELKLGKPRVPYSYHIKMNDYSGNETVTPAKTFVASAANQGALGFITDAFTRSFGWLGKFIKL